MGELRVNKKLLIAITIFIIFSVSARELVPENPNFNYITISASSLESSYMNNTSINFCLSATGYTHCFYIFPKNSTSNKTSLLYPAPGLDIIYLSNLSSPPSERYLSNLTSIQPIIIPNYRVNYTISNKSNHVLLNLNKNFTKGYYFFYLTAVRSDTTYKNIISIRYENQVFKIT